jgi:hypothetical protein
MPPREGGLKYLHRNLARRKGDGSRTRYFRVKLRDAVTGGQKDRHILLHVGGWTKGDGVNKQNKFRGLSQRENGACRRLVPTFADT